MQTMTSFILKSKKHNYHFFKQQTMEIEYSQEVRGKVFAYRFAQWEMQTIARCLKPEIKKLQKKIEKIENDPKNEGQATYQNQIEWLEREIKSLEEIIKEFSE